MKRRGEKRLKRRGQLMRDDERSNEEERQESETRGKDQERQRWRRGDIMRRAMRTGEMMEEMREYIKRRDKVETKSQDTMRRDEEKEEKS